MDLGKEWKEIKREGLERETLENNHHKSAGDC